MAARPPETTTPAARRAQTFGVSTSEQSVGLRLRDTTSGEVSPVVGQFVSQAPVLNTAKTPMYVFPVKPEATSAAGIPGLRLVVDTVIAAVYLPFGPTGGSVLGTDPPTPSGSPAPGQPPIFGP